MIAEIIWNLGVLVKEWLIKCVSPKMYVADEVS